MAPSEWTSRATSRTPRRPRNAWERSASGFWVTVSTETSDDLFINAVMFGNFIVQCVASPQSKCFVFFLKFRFPIRLHSNCSICPTTSGTCQKWFTKYHNRRDATQCISWSELNIFLWHRHLSFQEWRHTARPWWPRRRTTTGACCRTWVRAPAARTAAQRSSGRTSRGPSYPGRLSNPLR